MYFKAFQLLNYLVVSVKTTKEIYGPRNLKIWRLGN